jgi:hypothetical protein
VPWNERIFMINGAASCVEVQGGVDDPAVLLVSMAMKKSSRVASSMSSRVAR